MEIRYLTLHNSRNLEGFIEIFVREIRTGFTIRMSSE